MFGNRTESNSIELQLFSIGSGNQGLKQSYIKPVSSGFKKDNAIYKINKLCVSFNFKHGYTVKISCSVIIVLVKQYLTYTVIIINLILPSSPNLHCQLPTLLKRKIKYYRAANAIALNTCTTHPPPASWGTMAFLRGKLYKLRISLGQSKKIWSSFGVEL